MKRLIASSILFLSAVGVAQVSAEPATESRFSEEVVVTATYRETKLMETPVSISAITDAMVEDTGAQSMEDLFTLIPGLSMSGGGSGGQGEARYTVRGISSQSGNIGYAPVLATVGVYIDGTPVTSALGPDNQVSGTLFDIERVEVLKGPQGTLFGEGSQGGTIRYIYKKPDPTEFDAAVNVSYANMSGSDDNSSRLDAMVNVPLGDQAAFRLTGWTSETAGYIDNLTPVENDYNIGKSDGIRAALRFEGEAWSVTGTLHHSEQETEGGVATFGAYEALSARLPGLPPSSVDEIDIYSVDFEMDFGWATLHSLTSYTERTVDAVTEGTSEGASLLDFFYFGATDAADHEGCASAAQVGLAFGIPSLCPSWPGLFNLAGPAFTPDGRNLLAISSVADLSTEQWVQEIRLVSPGDQKLRWVVGGFWKDSEDHTGGNQTAGYYPGRDAAMAAFDPLLQGNPANNHNDFIEEYAIFGEVSYDLTEALELTVGVRVSDIKQHFQRSDRRTDDTPVSPKLVLSWEPTDNVMVYGGYTTGFRPGNVNNNLAWYADTFAGQGLDPEPILSGLFFDGDEVDSYELGVKATLFDGRVAIQSAAYFLKWKDMIVHEVNPAIGTGDVYNVNSGGADIKGLELEVNAFLTDRLNVRIAGDINDTEVTSAAEFSSSPKKSELIFAPSHSASVGINYSLPLDGGWMLDFYVDHSWVSSQYVNSQNSLEIPAFEKTNGRITARSADEKWRVALYGTNLNDNQILRGRTATGTLFWHTPRQIGLEVGYRLK
jgi:iron complex outermembrane receptor protein